MKKRTDNFPDDIRSYDNDPRSPFYEDPDAWMEEAAVELAEKWLAEYNQTSKIEDLYWDFDDVTYTIREAGEDPKDSNATYEILLNKAREYVESHPNEFKPEPDYGQEWD